MFYLKPLAKPTPTCWFSSVAVGHCKLDGTVARLCREANITGFRTNHSLCATAATRLYNAGVDEQQVMEVTGHRSLDGVRAYKHTSKKQKEAVSDILNCVPSQTTSACGSTYNSSINIDVSDSSALVTAATSGYSCGANSMNTLQSSSTTFTSPFTFNFQSCSVTMNIISNK